LLPKKQSKIHRAEPSVNDNDRLLLSDFIIIPGEQGTASQHHYLQELMVKQELMVTKSRKRTSMTFARWNYGKARYRACALSLNSNHQNCICLFKLFSVIYSRLKSGGLILTQE
jgi:hypothetical protein